MASQFLFSIETSATFSPCRRYRYTLVRIWDHALPLLNFLMLNPSTADEVKNDPTVERCERRARRLGYGGIIVTNIFAWRSTDPNVLALVDDPVGSDNDAVLIETAMRCQMTICAWGVNGALNGRGETVRQRLSAIKTLHVLRLTKKTAVPEHPLYIGYDVQPVVWSKAA